MSRSTPPEAVPDLRREQLAILGALLLVAAASWIVVFWQARAMGAPSMDRMLTMGMSAGIFMSMWVLMMVAMMFPAAAPMILTFAQISRTSQRRGQAFVPVWVFVGAYLAVWALFGIVAYVVALTLEDLASRHPLLMVEGPRIGGAVLVFAGIYQLTPLKDACLNTCRSPMTWIMTSWRDGYLGAFRMGFAHGMYCLGCCWLLFVILFPVGIMNVVAMGIVTALIYAEKTIAQGQNVARVFGIAIAVYGLVVMWHPSALPTIPMSPLAAG